VPEPNFSKYDHIAILLQPTYSKKLKAKAVSVMTVQKWSDDALSELRDCLQTTNIDVFRVATDNSHDYTATVICYISWCTFICVPPRIYRRFPNQKPCFNQEIQAKIREWSMAFQSGNEQQYRLARYALLKSIRTAKKSRTE
jgi:hypothetical protein